MPLGKCIFRGALNLYKAYPESEEIISNDTKEIYRSDDYFVKVWNNVSTDTSNQESLIGCINFFTKVETLQSSNPFYLPEIVDFGLTHKSELYLVQNFIDSPTWKSWASTQLTEEDKKAAIYALLEAIEHLHSMDFDHGDLHPENVLVQQNEEGIVVFLIDLPSYSQDSRGSLNHRYSPEYIETATPTECDNYAVMRMSAELLGLEWDNLSDSLAYEVLSNALQNERLSDNGFLSLDLFKAALNQEFLPAEPPSKIIEVTLRQGDYEIPENILPDNKELFVCIEKAKKTNEVCIKLYGINAQWAVFFDTVSNKLKGHLPLRSEDRIPPKVFDEAQLSVDWHMKINQAQYTDYSELEKALLAQETFLPLCKDVINPQEDSSPGAKTDDISSDDVLAQLIKNVAPAPNLPPTLSNDVNQNNKSLSLSERLSTRSIWKAIMDTETEALPSIEVAEEPKLTKDQNEWIVSYDSDGEILDTFSKDDEVLVIKKEEEKEFNLGKLNLAKSTSSQIRLPVKKATLKMGDILYLRTNQDKASYTRRKRAMERVLNRLSVIPDLVNYFEPSLNVKPTYYEQEPTEEDLSRYDREDKGHKISLNKPQREAFKKLFTGGPVSLLQGPLGTGKTEFISSFVHFLLDKEHANNILLVRQSHEAVNTAVERIRSHCQRLETPIDIVRFSNSEFSVSENLKDVYSRNIIESQRQRFIAEVKERVEAIQPAIKIDAEYLQAFVSAELGIKKKLQHLVRLKSDSNEDGNSTEAKINQNAVSRLEEQLKREVYETYDIQDFDIETLSDNIDSHINQIYNIAPHEYRKVKDLIELIDDYKSRLATNPASYEGFLASARTLVCGTCVGMGLRHLNVNAIQYDWIIIDEAARSISSEMAIAMQSAKRILLVGDHKQLPPL